VCLIIIFLRTKEGLNPYWAFEGPQMVKGFIGGGLEKRLF